MTIVLTIMSPSQQVDDIKIECDSTWTIGQVKDYLSTSYPTHPDTNQQKIIYAGRLLPNHLTIKDVVSENSGSFIMHLVCPQPISSDIPEAAKVNDANVMDSVDTSQPPDAGQFPSSIYADGIRQRMIDPQAFMSNVYSQLHSPHVNGASIPAPYMAYSMAMQQNYMQFLSQCLAQGNGSYPWSIPANLASQSPNTATVPSDTSRNENSPPQNVPRQRVVEEEEYRGHDFLDVVYLFSRALLLATILYFYSSPIRVLSALLLGMIFLIYRAERLPERQQQSQNSRRRAQNSEARNNADRSSNSNEADATTDGGSDESAEGRPDAEAENGPSKIALTFTFIKTLFSSLIPDPFPPRIN